MAVNTELVCHHPRVECHSEDLVHVDHSDPSQPHNRRIAGTFRCCKCTPFVKECVSEPFTSNFETNKDEATEVVALI